MSKVFKYGGWVVLSKYWEGDIDLCPHEWFSTPIHRVEEITVHICRRSGCLGFHSSYRTSLEKFINFMRSLPKLPRVPVTGYVAPREMARRLNEDERTVLKYFQVIKDFETDGVLSYIMADSKLFVYRDDPESKVPPILVGPLIFAAMGGGIGAKVSKGNPFLAALMTFVSGLLGYGVEAWWRGLSQNIRQVSHPAGDVHRPLRSSRYDSILCPYPEDLASSNEEEVPNYAFDFLP